jgi:CBS domain containing-hemolysin-like protein
MQKEVRRFRDVQLKELVEHKRKLIYVHSDTTVKECTDLLKQKEILSVPVYDKEKKEFIGIVDVLDIMIAQIFRNTKSSEGNYSCNPILLMDC